MARLPANTRRVTVFTRETELTTQGTGEPLIGGVDFWMVAGFALIVDIAQVMGLIGNGLATALMASASFPVIGWILALVTVPAGAMLNFGILIIGLMLGFILSGTIILFCFFKKIPLSMNRTAAQAVTFLLEQIPLMNILPFNTLNIMLLRYFENQRRKGDGLLKKAVGAVVNATPIGRVGKMLIK